MLLSLVFIVVSSISSFWNITLNDVGSYNLIFNNNTIISDSCSEFTLFKYETRVSVCDKSLYRLPTLSLIKNSDITEVTLIYEPVINPLLPTINNVFILPVDSNSTIIMYVNMSKTIETNWMSPLYGGKWDMGFDKTRILQVPFDNDLQSMYMSIDAGPLSKGTSSYVTSFYDDSNVSNKGLIMGFLEHNVWKTGIEYDGNKINAIAGTNNILITRDREPHGVVNISKTPLLYISINDDWRYGLEDYSKTIERILPFKVNKTLEPFSGWNSWAMAIAGLGVPKVNTLKSVVDTMSNITSLKGDKYIVRDAIYFLNETQTQEWVSYAHNRSMKVGTYSSPFVLYAPVSEFIHIGCDSNLCNKTEKNCYSTSEIVLKDKNNVPIKLVEPKSKLKHILDVTHPIAKCMLEYRIREIKERKMDLVKYDFLNLAAYEGQRYNMTLAPTGMAAYYYAATMISELWNNEVVLNFGISPPFPIIKGMNTRRQGCDQMFGGVEYTMNQYAGGWWLKNFYILNPDLINLQEEYWFTPKLKKITGSFAVDSRSRIAKAIVYGGEYKSGDDLSNITNSQIMQTYFGNEKINRMWSISKTGQFNTSFRPISWELEKTIVPILPNIIAPSTYIRDNGDVVIFNFGLFKKTFNVDLKETNLDKKTIICLDLWENKRVNTAGFTIKYSVSAKSAAILECRSE